MRWIIIKLIRIYQLFFSYRVFPNCKYHPSCSEFAIQAIEKHGAFFGFVKGAWRIIRCNPLSKGGVDLP